MSVGPERVFSGAKHTTLAPERINTLKSRNIGDDGMIEELGITPGITTSAKWCICRPLWRRAQMPLNYSVIGILKQISFVNLTVDSYGAKQIADSVV